MNKKEIINREVDLLDKLDSGLWDLPATDIQNIIDFLKSSLNRAITDSLDAVEVDEFDKNFPFNTPRQKFED